MIIVVILLNGLSMAIERPGVDMPYLDILEQIFLLLFTAEMTLKLTAYGWGGYIRDRWNVLDFAVVLSGWAPLVLSNDANLSSVRLLRLLRMATLVRRVASMRHVVGVLFASLLQLADVMALFVFFMFVYGVVGVQLFSGALHRCAQSVA